MYYIKHRQFKNQIVVTQNGWLVDGLCDYIVAVMCGMETVMCEVSQKRYHFKKRCEKRLQQDLSVGKEEYCIKDKRGNVQSVENSYRLMIIPAKTIT